MHTPEANGWFEACKKEINNLNKKDMPDGKQIFKARVVIKGFAQRQGLDYNDTYAPVIRGDSLRLILAIITAAGMKCRQGDATNAYIHAKSDRELYMIPPDGFEAKGKCWRILGALYGLKQSAMLWYQHLKTILEDFEFMATSSDSCVFTRRIDGRLQIVTVYVDGVFNLHIRLNDLGPITKLLGMEIKRDEESLKTYVTQETYIQRMAVKYGLVNCKHVNTPIPVGTNLTEDPGMPLEDYKPYRQIVGSILYCAMATRPDIVHAVTQLSRHLSSPCQLHMLMARRVVAYLWHTKEVGIYFHGQPSGSDKLIGFSDSSWADDRSTGPSTCGYVWILACGPVSWRSKLQAIVTLSSTEAEYVGACLAAQHGMHLNNLLDELGLEVSEEKLTLYLDNQSAIAIG
ncbi:hypothetical protein Ae201684P_012086 [Aphanomyces euteiches]|nr:hypothetical protein Ae201684P_012086 [Aphanomyces euteiches]